MKVLQNRPMGPKGPLGVGTGAGERRGAHNVKVRVTEYVFHRKSQLFMNCRGLVNTWLKLCPAVMKERWEINRNQHDLLAYDFAMILL